MRITTPEVVWHGGEAGKNDPVLSVDVHPCGVLATGGADGEVRFWVLHLEENEESRFQDYLYSFENHERSVNVVRFSPDGRALATASDGGTIFVYVLPKGRPASLWKKAKAHRLVEAMLVRSTQSDIYDLAWCPNSRELASVSVDNRVNFWDLGDPEAEARRRKPMAIAGFTSHANYVQGVAWDPRDRFVVSQSNDRSCRVYRKAGEDDDGGKNKKGKKSKKAKRPAGPPFTEYAQLRLAARPGDKKEEESCIVAVKSSSFGGGGGRKHIAADDDSGDDMDVGGAGAKASTSTSSGSGAAAAGDSSSSATTASGSTSTSTGGGDDKKGEGEEGAMEEDNEVEIVGVKEAPAAAAAPTAAAPAATAKRAPRPHLFADETVPSFFRRPAWSPDGCLLVTPAGLYRPNDSSGGSGGGKAEFATHVYRRDKFDRPVLELPHPGCKASVAVRFCPQLFALRPPPSRDGRQPTMEEKGKEPAAAEAPPGSAPPLTNLPYRMVFAVVTVNGVLVYDTQHHFPLAFVKNSHYAPLTDVAWLSDGRALVATSMDGYITILSFPDGELGTPLDLDTVPPPAKRAYAAYYEGMRRAAEGEEEERAEEEERKAREERRRAKEEAKAAAKAKERKAKEEAGGGKAGGEKDDASIIDVVDGSDSESSAASSVSSSSASASAAAAKRRAKKQQQQQQQEDEEEGEEGGEKRAASKRGAGGGASDGESLMSEDRSDDEEDEEDEDSEGEGEEEGDGKKKEGEGWQTVGDDSSRSADEWDGRDAAGAAGKEKKEKGKKRPSSDMAEDQPAAAAAATAATASGGGEKKGAKRIKPTLVSTDPSSSSSPSALAAAASAPSPSSPSSSSSPASDKENDKAKEKEKGKEAAPSASAPVEGKSIPKAPASASAAAASGKLKKRVAPTLVSSNH